MVIKTGNFSGEGEFLKEQEKGYIWHADIYLQLPSKILMTLGDGRSTHHFLCVTQSLGDFCLSNRKPISNQTKKCISKRTPSMKGHVQYQHAA